MNAHVSKPVEMKVLEKTIRSIKSGGGGTEPQVIEQERRNRKACYYPRQ